MANLVLHTYPRYGSAGVKGKAWQICSTVTYNNNRTVKHAIYYANTQNFEDKCVCYMQLEQTYFIYVMHTNNIQKHSGPSYVSTR